MDNPAAQVTLGKVGSRLNRVGLAFSVFIPTDGVTIVPPSVSGLGGAVRWGGNYRAGTRARGAGRFGGGARWEGYECIRRGVLRHGGATGMR